MRGKKRFIKLTTDQEADLVTGFKTGKKATFRQRCHYLILSNQKRDIQEIAAIYQVSRQVIARWFDRYMESGIEGLHTKKGQGEKPILCIDNEEHVSTVRELVEEHPQDLDPVIAKLEQRLGMPMSGRTLRRFLKKLVTAGNGSAG